MNFFPYGLLFQRRRTLSNITLMTCDSVMTHLKVNYFVRWHIGDGNQTRCVPVPPFSTTQVNVRRMAFEAKSDWNDLECKIILLWLEPLISWCRTDFPVGHRG